MKKYAYISFLFVMMLFVSVTYTACKKDNCKKVNCSNGGTCLDGTCLCPTGYSGKSCETLTRDGYVKSYKGDGEDTEGDKYLQNKLVFTTGGEDITTMKLELKDQNDILVNTFDVKLESNSSFTIVSKTDGSSTYTGTGSISATTASLMLTINNGNSSFNINFPNMAAQ